MVVLGTYWCILTHIEKLTKLLRKRLIRQLIIYHCHLLSYYNWKPSSLAP